MIISIFLFYFSPCKAFIMIKLFPSKVSNSGPASMHTFSFVNNSRQALPISVTYDSRPFSYARKRTKLIPLRDVTAEQALDSGTSVTCPSVTNLVLCLPSFFTSKKRWVPIFLWSLGA